MKRVGKFVVDLFLRASPFLKFLVLLHMFLVVVSVVILAQIPTGEPRWMKVVGTFGMIAIFSSFCVFMLWVDMKAPDPLLAGTDEKSLLLLRLLVRLMLCFANYAAVSMIMKDLQRLNGA